MEAVRAEREESVFGLCEIKRPRGSLSMPNTTIMGINYLP